MQVFLFHVFNQMKNSVTLCVDRYPEWLNNQYILSPETVSKEHPLDYLSLSLM